MVKDQIECLDRLFSIGDYMNEMVDFFVTEGIMAKTDIPVLKAFPDKAKWIQLLIAKNKENGKLQLVDYEWQILPYERIRIYLVTARMEKEFLYNNV